jgi:hypothetical protein
MNMKMRAQIENAEGIFTGGGSTLYWSMNYTKQHHDRIAETIKKRVP